MIYVDGVTKEFKKVVKDSGLKGSVKSLFNRKYNIVKAVNDISFHVPKGEILGFIGANGAGKSTTIKMLTGILTPTEGRIEINGQIPFKNRKKYVKEIGVVFGQRTQLWWDLPLVETFSVLKQVYQVEDKAFNERMAFLNEVLELNDFIKSPVRTLSLGQRMRADLAASMIHNPKVLFLDEPTIGLDVAVKNNIRKAITEINEQEKTTIILTTHDLNDIESLCKRIVMIDKGKLVYDGSLTEMKTQFGKYREVNMSLFSNEDFDKLNFVSEFKVNDEDIKINRSKEKITVTFNSEKISISNMLSYILKNVQVKDISVNDVNIEEIICRMYGKEVSD
ncbi:MAG: ATP-binding cassette domain-containing protein [Lachnospiraceae bacterium]|nr:ATP-binding cassette domain-containing protein [Lachnospiraceae bacterium]MDE6698084.1 ATP-binding cassette domain-containing protein [Lachnospiraceae bacterium]